MTEFEQSTLILEHARKAIGVVDAGIYFDPAAAATSLAMALGYLCGTFGIDPRVCYEVIVESTCPRVVAGIQAHTS